MSTDHDDVRMLIGAYVLGGLSETDRRVLESHLPTCQECRDELAHSAPLAGLLRRAPGMSAPSPQATREADTDAAPPASSAGLDRLLEQVRAADVARRRRARRQWLALAAALIVVAGLGLGSLLPLRHSTGPATAFTSAAGYSVSGRATLTAKPWGTAVSVTLADLPAGAPGPFILQVSSVDGRKEQAATWAITPNGSAAVTGASALHLPDIRSISVMDHAGRLVATTRPL
ncbi:MULTISPECIES: anti-sigma factor family protein [Streptomyces]|uniref:anti-sigma factor family protein n=1 Tax=Streptomyces TaxID=1883 RepID=UPI002E763A53|nr:zf-HC2 domain-containing protein [Streptomyces sp. BE133]MEE1809317.1 zf-HC2 domain-containing protein [Streptomyces sp. BE133]